MLRVNGSESFKIVVLNALQHLDMRAEYINGNTVNLDPTVQGHSGGVKSRALLEGLIRSGYQITIEQTGGQSECVPSHRGAARTGSTVRWNPNQTLPSAPACQCIYLGHELCHSRQLILGQISPSEYYAGRAAQMSYEMRTITGEGAPQDAITENDLRREHVPPQRMRTSL